MTFMLFLGMANAYVMRTNMSVAIVAMVNHTAIANLSNDENEPVDTECDAYLGSVSIFLVSLPSFGVLVTLPSRRCYATVRR